MFSILPAECGIISINNISANGPFVWYRIYWESLCWADFMKQKFSVPQVKWVHEGLAKQIPPHSSPVLSCFQISKPEKSQLSAHFTWPLFPSRQSIFPIKIKEKKIKCLRYYAFCVKVFRLINVITIIGQLRFLWRNRRAIV